MTITIPRQFLPSDGRFGSGPAKIRTAQLDALHEDGVSLIGTSHRKAPVKALVASIKAQLSALFAAPDGYEVNLGNGGSTAFWDAAAFGLIEQRSQHLTFGEFGNKFAAAAHAPWLSAPDVRAALPGTRSDSDILPGIDLYAWPHNETSTGVAAPVHRVNAQGALTVINATSAVGGMTFTATDTDVYYFAPLKNFGSDGGLWVALVSPAAIERIERIAASGRYIPESLSLKSALDNSRLDQTLNTPALVTLHLLNSQLAWILEQGGLPWACARVTESSGLLYEWAERSPAASPFVSETADRSPVVATIDFVDSIDAALVARALRANGIVDTEPYRKLGRNQLVMI